MKIELNNEEFNEKSLCVHRTFSVMTLETDKINDSHWIFLLTFDPKRISAYFKNINSRTYWK